jgi:hypothetical protein
MDTTTEVKPIFFSDYFVIYSHQKTFSFACQLLFLSLMATAGEYKVTGGERKKIILQRGVVILNENQSNTRW